MFVVVVVVVVVVVKVLLSYPTALTKEMTYPWVKEIRQHREVPKIVLQRVKDHGITSNREKCQFRKEQIELFGHFFTKDGLKPSPDKVRAIRESGVPGSKETVRSETTGAFFDQGKPIILRTEAR